MVYVWHVDPGHSWLQVPKTSLGGFKPSGYSYQDRTSVYLEEDCDAPGWMQMVGLDQTTTKIKEVYYPDTCPIRNKPRC